MNIREQVPLAPYTTFNIGGPARYFVEVKNEAELQEAYEFAHERHAPVLMLSGGSNMLISDNGFDGLAIKVLINTITIDENEHTITAGAGVVLRDAIMKSAEHGLSGWESMYGIPGTVGGAVRGNAGAFGSEAADVVKEVRAFNCTTQEIRVWQHAECAFAYRMSFFKKHPEWIVTEATFKLTPKEPELCIAAAQATLAEREKRQIQNIQSAGSFFMNPIAPRDVCILFEEEKGVEARGGRVPAGWLIDRAGFKGYDEAHVATGARSSNYIINKGGATASEVLALAEKIREAVKKQFNVELHMEVQLVGAHSN